MDPFYKELFTRAVSVGNESEGARKVREEKYVFIFETPIIDYEFRSDCDVVKIGAEFQTFEYALGFPKEAPYAELINSYILHYRETGVLDSFWSRWLAIQDSSADCPGTMGGGRKLTLGMSSMAGIFFALAIALTFGLVILVMECVVAAMRDARGNSDSTKRSYWEALVDRIHHLASYSFSSRSVYRHDVIEEEEEENYTDRFPNKPRQNSIM